MLNRLACLLLSAGLFVPARSAPAQARAPARASDTSWVARSVLSWVARSVLYEVFVRDFSPSGTFRGVIEGLDVRETGYGATIWNAASSRFGEATGAPWRRIRTGSRWRR
jgi:hypothetical protein